MNENLESKFQIHYYFNDNSHSMNAIVKNKIDKDLIDAIYKISNILNIENFNIDTSAYEEGGIKENLIFVGGLIFGGFTPAINDIVTHYFIKDAVVIELAKQIQVETLKGLKLDNKKKTFEVNKLFEDKGVIRDVSNYYKKVDCYSKIQEIGFKDIKTNVEYKVKKEDFKNFILEDDIETEIDEEANIEIISPVLNNGTYKWKGLYKDELISFSMGDRKFKKEVVDKKYKFANGNSIICTLQIRTKYDEFGDMINQPSYSVQTVLEVTDTIGIKRVTLKGKKKKEKEELKSRSLFDDEA
ncbi:MAG: hypothetical protein HRT42_10080 [Campylobacteraceae bacterium]|nr:hypothetical protein [Campylobacteraceae bacterium]